MEFSKDYFDYIRPYHTSLGSEFGADKTYPIGSGTLVKFSICGCF